MWDYHVFKRNRNKIKQAPGTWLYLTFTLIVPAEKLHLNRLCGTSMYSKVLALSSTRVTQMFTARQESFPGDGNHDVHKITHSAKSERFGRYG